MKFRGKMKGMGCKIKEKVKSEKAVKVRCSGWAHGRANRVASLTNDGAQVLRLEMQPKR